MRRKHAILQTIEILAVDGWDEFARRETEEDAGGEVVFADSVSELEILVEHGAEGEWDGLYLLVWYLKERKGDVSEGITLRYMCEVGGGGGESEGIAVRGWVSFNSKRMPPIHISTQSSRNRYRRQTW